MALLVLLLWMLLISLSITLKFAIVRCDDMYYFTLGEAVQRPDSVLAASNVALSKGLLARASLAAKSMNSGVWTWASKRLGFFR
ncbi:hypothetical protein ACH5RR_012213 [Cinchona calisaya]|uniref:Secreted protein n=1 Tax=Cinchona calisaya TaxID=153742 RepID=A0ABD3A9Q6_9GENT